LDGTVIVGLLVAFIAAWALVIVVPLMRPRDIALAGGTIHTW
jgi:hypothetical protein